MKPNFKSKQEPVKNTLNHQQNSSNRKVEQQIEDQSEDFTPLGESLVGQRQFIFFKNPNHQQHQSTPIEQNISLVGPTQKVYFSNASTLNKQQILKNQKLQSEIDAFKPSSKIIREEPQNFKKAKSTAPGLQTNKSIQDQEEDSNQFLELNNVAKWQKTNKSTIISEQMKKMNTHYQNRLTQTKWVKKKPQLEQKQKNSLTQKNISSVKDENSLIKSSIPSKTSTNSETKNTQNQLKNSVSLKKGTEKYIQGISDQTKAKLSEKTSWKQSEKKQKEEQVEQEEIQGEQSEEEEEQQDEEQQQEDDEEEQQDQGQGQEEEEENEEEEEDQKESSGDQGWDQPEEQPVEEEPQEQKQDPFTVPQKESVSEVKPKKWESTKNKTNSSQNINPSINIQNQQQGPSKKAQKENDIEDLTEGEIENDSVDPNWDKIQQILLRIQKLVN